MPSSKRQATRAKPNHPPPLDNSQRATAPHTEEYIKNNLALPMRAQLPAAPNALFQLVDGNIQNFTIEHLRAILPPQHVIFKNARFVMSPHQDLGMHLHCHKLSVSAHNSWTVKIYGEGPTKAQALQTCCLHAIALLHGSGLLNEFFGRPSVALFVQGLPGKGIDGGKIAVFDYAARYMLVPQLSTVPITRDILRLVRAQRRCNHDFNA